MVLWRWYQILVDARDKLIFHDGAVTLPVLPILNRAAFKVTTTAMNENCDEEDRIVIRDDCCPTNDHTPTEGHDPVGDVVLVGSQDTFMQGNAQHKTYRFARVPPPTANQQAVAAYNLRWHIEREQLVNLPVGSLDEFWILQGTPGQLRERVAERGNTLSVHFEAALLRHGGIPTVVHSQKERIYRDE